MSKKSIILVHLYNDRSGSPKVLMQTAKALFGNGYDVEIITSSHKGGFLDDAPGVRHTLFYRRSDNKIITLIYYLVSQFLLFFQCLQFLRRDVVFHINTMMPFGAALAARVMGKKVVYHVHESSIRPKLLKCFLRKIIKFTSSYVIFVSNFLQDNEGIGGNDIVIHNALEKNKSYLAKESADAFRVLMVCSLKRYKGVDEFLEIAKKTHLISDKIYFSLVLNASQEEVDDYFEMVCLPDNLSVYSRQEELENFYLSSSLLVNLSRPKEWVETFGLTILEGMSYSLPVIAPPVGGPAEIIQNNIQGFLIDSSEVDHIVDVIVDLQKDINSYHRMAKSAYQRSLDFEPEKFVHNIVNFYQQKVL